MYDLRVLSVNVGILDDAGVEHVELTMRLSRTEADTLVAAYRPGQTPTLLADDARSVAEPVVEALVALEPA